MANTYVVSIRTEMDNEALNRGAQQVRSIFDRLVKDVEGSTSRTGQSSAAAAQRGEDAYQKFYRTIEAGRQQYVTSQVQASEQIASKLISDTVRAGQERVRVEQQTSAEVLRIRAQTAQQAAQQQSIQNRAARVIGDPGGAVTGIPQAGSIATREGKRAADELAQSLAGANAQTQNLNASTLIFGITLGNIVANQVQNFIGLLKEAVVGSALYASRTQEMGLALEAVARANNIATASVKGQELAIEKLNITSQDTREVLTKMVIAQLDYTKATQLATSAQDLAISTGKNTAEELQDLVQGITTLQSRVLRNAGVFTTAEEAEKKYALQIGRTVDSLTTQEKQTAVLNEVLLQGARATGAYDAAMESASKQLRSLTGRIIPEAQNAFGAMFDVPLRAVIKSLIFFFELVQKYPGGILVAAISATTAAFIALNVAMSTWNTSIFGATLGAIKTLIASMAALATEAELTTATLIAGTAGWAALAAGIGLAVYAIYQYVTAEKELPEINERILVTTGKVIEALKDDAKWFENSSGAMQTHGEYAGRLENVLRRLDPVQAAQIKRVSDETQQRKSLLAAINQQVGIEQQARDREIAALVTVGAAEAKAYQDKIASYDTFTKSIQNYQAELAKYAGKRDDFLPPGQTRTLAEMRTHLEHMREDLRGISAEIVSGSPKYQQAVGYLAELSRSANQSAEAFLKAQLHTDSLSASQRQFAADADRVNEDLKHQAEYAKSAAGAFEAYQNALSKFKPPEPEVGKTIEGIKKQWDLLNESFGTFLKGQEEAVNQGAKIDPYKESIRAFASEFNKLDKATADAMGGGYGAFIRSLPDEEQKALRASAALGVQAQATKSLSEKAVEAANARKKANEELDQLDKQLIQRLSELFEQHKELNDEIGKSPDALKDYDQWWSKVDQKTRDMIDANPKLQKTLQAIHAEAQSFSKDQTTHSMAEWIAKANDEAARLSGTVDKADTPLKKLQAEFLKTGLAARASAGEMVLWQSALDAVQKAIDAAKMQSAADDWEAFKKEVFEVGVQLDQLTKPREETALERIIGKLQGDQKLNIPVGQIQALVQLSKDAASGDPDKLIKLVNALKSYIYALGTGPATPEEMNKQAAALANYLKAFAEADTPGGRSIQRATDLQKNLQHTLEESQHAISDAAVTESTRYAIAWQDAINDVVLADDRARESIIHSQVIIADQTVLHAEQVRAQVLDRFARDKSVSEIWAEGFTGAADAVTQSISSAIDVVTKKLGVFGNVLKNILTDLAKLTIDRIFRRLLDSILPPSSAGGGSLILGGGGGGRTAASGGGLMNLLGAGLPFLTGGFAGGGGANVYLGSGNTGSRLLQGLLSGPGGMLPTGGSLLGGDDGGSATSTWRDFARLVPGNTPQLESVLKGGLGKTGAAGSLTGILSALGSSPLLPLMGAGIGFGLGGSSKTGGILGALGAGILGAGVAGGLAFAGSGALAGGLGLGISSSFISSIPGLGALSGLFGGLGGSLGAFAAVAGPMAVIAAPLIIGALLLARNSQRRKDETFRASLSSDTYGKVAALLTAAQKGDLTVSEAQAQFNQIHSDYLQQVATMKDSKTKRIATQWWDNDVAPFYWPRIESAAKAGQAAKAFTSTFVPTYRSGVDMMVPRASRGLLELPGRFDGRDDLMMRVSRGERVAVMTPEQYERIGGRQAFEDAGVPALAGGGVTNSNQASGNSNTKKKDGGNGGGVTLVALGDAQLKILAQILGDDVEQILTAKVLTGSTLSKAIEKDINKRNR
jgi:hypothetical protein